MNLFCFLMVNTSSDISFGALIIESTNSFVSDISLVNATNGSHLPK